MKDNKKLFVGGLEWGIGDLDLKEAFTKFGTVVDAKVIVDRETGRSRGFGFVTFGDADDADDARTEMDGASLSGRTVRVDFATDKQRSGSGGRRRDDRR